MWFVFYLNGEAVSKKNANKFCFTTKSVYKSKWFCKWHKMAKEQVEEQVLCRYSGLLKKPLERVERIEMDFFHKDNSRRDTDNQITSIMDLLVDCGVIKDDKWTIVKSIYAKAQKGNVPCCVVRVMTKEEDKKEEGKDKKEEEGNAKGR